MTIAVAEMRRLEALRLAAGTGLPAKMVLEAARSYLAFLEGSEPVTASWEAMAPVVLRNLKAQVASAVKAKTKAVPKPRSRRRA